MLLEIILMYVFAIALRLLTDNTEFGARWFPSITYSMYTLLIYGVFMDSLTDLTGELINEDSDMMSYIWFIVFLVFCALAALMVMNMLIGVLCEVVSAVAAVEKEEIAICYFKERMGKFFQSMDQ